MSDNQEDSSDLNLPCPVSRNRNLHCKDQTRQTGALSFRAKRQGLPGGSGCSSGKPVITIGSPVLSRPALPNHRTASHMYQVPTVILEKITGDEGLKKSRC